MKKIYLSLKRYLVQLVLVSIIFSLSTVWLSAEYSNTSSVVDSVGNKATGGTYEMLSAGGQSVIGNSSGD